MTNFKPWPDDCVWPDPAVPACYEWEADDVDFFTLDDEGRDLLMIKEYYDGLVLSGFLRDDYTIDPEYEPSIDFIEEYFSPDEFQPSEGEDYWVDGEGFMYSWWQDEFTDHMNSLKVGFSGDCDPVGELRNIIGYEFINENLLRQAFTRKAFDIEYDLGGNYEELEFIGDSILNTIVTREIVRQLYTVDLIDNAAPFKISYREGELSKIRQKFASGEHLSKRGRDLGLEKYILYGMGEPHTDSSLEDVIEAIIGAVAIDSGWDKDALEKVVDNLVCVQISQIGTILHKSYYEMLNSWHQKHFGYVPDYQIDGVNRYECTLRFEIPENDKGIWRSQKAFGIGETRSEARECAAESAYLFICRNGLWRDLRDSGIEPDLENSINQLQELYQKKYIPELPEYIIEETSLYSGGWKCNCVLEGDSEVGYGSSKTKAKKAAAFNMLVSLFRSSGITDEKWDEIGLMEFSDLARQS